MALAVAEDPMMSISAWAIDLSCLLNSLGNWLVQSKVIDHLSKIFN